MKSLVEYVCIYRQNLAISDLQGLICHKTQTTKQPKRPPEEIPDGLCYSLSVDLSNTAWAQRRLINKLSGNTFGTGPSGSVKIGAGPNYGTIFGIVPKIKAPTVQNVVSYIAGGRQEVSVTLSKALEWSVCASLCVCLIVGWSWVCVCVCVGMCVHI